MNSLRAMIAQRFAVSSALILAAATVLIDAPTGYRLPHDISSYIYAAQAQSIHGSGYSAAFINRPPLLLLLLRIWDIMTPSLIGRWHLLHGLCLFLVIYPLIKIGELFCKSAISIALCALLTTTLYFSGYVDMFLSTEIIGLSFFVSGIWLLLKSATSQIRFVCALAFCGSSALIREQFLLAVLMVVFYVIVRRKREKGWISALRESVLALAIPILIAVTYLFLSDSLNEYLNILRWSNSRESSVPTYWFWDALTASAVALPILRHSGGNPIVDFLAVRRGDPQSQIFVIVITLIFLQLASSIKRGSISNTTRIGRIDGDRTTSCLFVHKTLVAVAALGLMIGVAHQSQGNRFNGHYAIATLIALYLMLLALLLGPATQHSQTHRITVIIICTITIFPTTTALRNLSESMSRLSVEVTLVNLVRPINSVATAEESYVRVNSSRDNSDCALNLYGWGLGDFYIYSGVPSCSRYFLSPLIGEGTEAMRFRRELIENPPKWIRLGCKADECADHSVDEFETLTFPTQKVLDACYTPVASIGQSQPRFPTLFEPQMQSRAELQLCISSVLEATDLKLD